MIVVGIIGILAAIAIPTFLNYQLKAKTAEAKTNIGGIRTSQDSYKAENDAYLVCAVSPAGGGQSVKTPWVDAGGYGSIGFFPVGEVYYMYEVVIANGAGGAAGQEVAIDAQGDLDDDTNDAFFTMSSNATTVGGQSGVASTKAWEITGSGDDF